MKKLITMTEFVLKENSKDYLELDTDSFTNEKLKIYLGALLRIDKYAQLLQTPLELGQFIPCDEDGEPMEEPKLTDYVFEEHPELVGNPKELDRDRYKEAEIEYQKALESVLFEGYKWDSNYECARRWVDGVLQSQFILSDGKGNSVMKRQANGETIYLKLPCTIEDLINSGIELTLISKAE